jgi:hypothetical protein
MLIRGQTSWGSLTYLQQKESTIASAEGINEGLNKGIKEGINLVQAPAAKRVVGR